MILAWWFGSAGPGLVLARDSRLRKGGLGAGWLRRAVRGTVTCKAKKFCRRRVGTLSGESPSKTAACDGETVPKFDSNQASTRHAASDGHFLNAATGSEGRGGKPDAPAQRWLQKASVSLVCASHACGN